MYNPYTPFKHGFGAEVSYQGAFLSETEFAKGQSQSQDLQMVTVRARMRNLLQTNDRYPTES